MKILITGITGFVGSHLAEYCLKNGDDVYGTIRSHHLGDELERVSGIKNDIKLYECNLMNRSSVFNVVMKTKPDIIFHLAAHSFVPMSWDEPEEVLKNNIISELNIFESIRDLDLIDKTVIHIAGSSEEYGFVSPSDCPITEENELRPMSTYAVSKIGQEFLAKQYYRSYGIKTVITRAFNHEGPRRGIDFVTSSFASQIAKLESKKLKEGVIKVGNLDSKRDFTDVRDMVKAYYLIVSNSNINYGEEYNISSGESHLISEVLDYFISKSTINIKIEQDASRMRPSDVTILEGDSSKFRKVTGWKPEIGFHKMLDDILEYWREKYNVK